MFYSYILEYYEEFQTNIEARTLGLQGQALQGFCHCEFRTRTEAIQYPVMLNLFQHRSRLILNQVQDDGGGSGNDGGA